MESGYKKEHLMVVQKLKKKKNKIKRSSLWGIVLAVKKLGNLCIASDSMIISGGSRKQTSTQISNIEKIIKCDTFYIGVADHPVWQLV